MDFILHTTEPGAVYLRRSLYVCVCGCCWCNALGITLTPVFTIVVHYFYSPASSRAHTYTRRSAIFHFTPKWVIWYTFYGRIWLIYINNETWCEKLESFSLYLPKHCGEIHPNVPRYRGSRSGVTLALTASEYNIDFLGELVTIHACDYVKDNRIRLI